MRISLGDLMQTHKKIIIALLAVVMLGISLPAASAQSHQLDYEHSNGIVSMSTDEIEIRVVGANEQPHFHWWSPDNPAYDYHMRFVSTQENLDQKRNKVIDRLLKDTTPL